MSSSSSGGQGQSSASPSEDDAFGPFVTVVSVDGGLQCGNKLTVITPTEICETAKQGKQAVIRKLDTSHDKVSPSQSSSPLRSSSKLIQPSGNFGKAVNTNNSGIGSIPSSSKQHQQQQRNKHGVETTTNKMSSASSSVSGSGTAYVTVVALSEEQSLHETTGKGKPKSGIPVRAEPSSLSNKKSVVNICNSTSSNHSAKGPSSSSPYLPDATAFHSENRAQVPPKLPPRNGGNVGEDQVVTIGNKAPITKGKDIPHIHQVKNASIVEITMKEFSNRAMMMSSHGGGGGINNDTNACDDENASWENGIPTKIREAVIVFRLPGERLGFALKFDGGTAAAAQKVNHLYIQSCAEGSPAKRTTTSWGHLREGDEIVEIEKIPVNSMTRMDCVQALKDSSVAVQLLIEHAYSQEELQILHELQKSESSQSGEMKDSKMKCNANKRERHPASSNCNAGSGIPTFHKQTKEALVQNNNKEMYQKSGAYSTETGNSEKGMISNNPNQRVTSNQQEVERKRNKSSEMTEAASSETHANTNASLSTKCDTSEIKFDDDEIGTGRSHSRIPIKRGQATLSLSKSMKGKYNNAATSDYNEYADNNNAFASSRNGEERLDELQLQPPVGFEDELQHSQHFSVGQSNYYEGRNKSENLEFVNDRHYKANEASNENFIESSEEDMTLLQAISENHQHNVMEPESMAINNSNIINAAGSTNGNNQNLHQNNHHHLHRVSSNGSNTSLNNSNSFVHLSGNENLSISTWSDETESTRSTVVSRLSIGSSMTSISAVMAIPACCNGGNDNNNNQVTLTQISEGLNVNNNNHASNCHHKRKSSPNSSLTSYCTSTHGGGVVMGLDSLKPHGVDERTNKKQNSLNHQQHHETDLHHYQHLQQQVGQQVQDRSVNNVTTIPYSSACSRPSVTMPSEIPLEPPLSFQDEQEQVSKRRGYAFAADHKTQTFSSNIITAANGATPSIHSENQDEKATLVENSNDANDVAGGLMMAKTNVSSSLQMHQQKIQEQQSAMSAQNHHQQQPCVNNYGFGGGTRKEYIGGNSTNNNDLFNGTGNSRAISIMDGNNNEQEIFDDDELALLADELGLDQEDEDLFKAMLAEVEASDELEEYGPIRSSPSPSVSSVAAQAMQQGDLGKVDQQIMMKANNTLIDDLKQEKSNCERNQRENVVSAKLGTVHKNYRSGANNDVTVDASDVIAFAVNDNGNNNYSKNILRNNDEAATVRIDCMVVAASKHPKGAAAVGQQCEVESWTISNSNDSRDVRGLGRIAM